VRFFLPPTLYRGGIPSPVASRNLDTQENNRLDSFWFARTPEENDSVSDAQTRNTILSNRPHLLERQMSQTVVPSHPFLEEFLMQSDLVARNLLWIDFFFIKKVLYWLNRMLGRHPCYINSFAPGSKITMGFEQAHQS